MIEISDPDLLYAIEVELEAAVSTGPIPDSPYSEIAEQLFAQLMGWA